MNVTMRRINGKLVEYTINGVAQPLDSEPSLIQKASNAAGAGGRAVKSILGGGKLFVDDPEQNRRLTICATCEFYTGSTCKKCGCHIRFKAKLTTEHCPINKW